MQKIFKLFIGLAVVAGLAACSNGGGGGGGGVGTLQINITGLPAGTDANVQITGDSNTLTATKTGTHNLTPGSYAFTAGTANSTGDTYTPDRANGNFTITAGRTTDLTINYTLDETTPDTGTLQINITGLPAGTDAAVEITGPESLTLGESGTHALAVGAYALTADRVSYNSETFTATPANTTFTITADDTTPINIVYALESTPGGGTGPVPSDYEDPADQTIPEPIQNPTTTPAFVASAPDENGIITLNVSPNVLAAAGLLSTQAADDLGPEDFTVIEDERVAGIVVQRIGVDHPAAADIVFVLDTTSSMGWGLNSIAHSIVKFLEHLEASGLDARVGAITFGDAFDTQGGANPGGNGVSFSGRTPPDFDQEERASFGLTSDYSAFRYFLVGDTTDDHMEQGYEVTEGEARGGGREGGDGPENALGAIEYAFDSTEIGWREEAQRVIIAITDNCSHNDVTYSNAGITGDWIPKSAEAVGAKIRGTATVHVIAPARVHELCTPVGGIGNHTNLWVLTGSRAFTTGGTFYDWADRRSLFDLTQLPLFNAVSSGYLVRYRATNSGPEQDRQIRLIINDGGEFRGETTRTLTY